MVLLMFAYRTHQRLSATTFISFEPKLGRERMAFEAKLNGEPFTTRQRVPIGWHTLTITNPKAKPFSTNLFIWYGERELGVVTLERATGVLAVKANPPAQSLVIFGTEFSTTLTNTPGLTSSVPTDRYVIQATYKYWQRREEVVIGADQTSPLVFAPKFGTLRIEASHADAIYRLRDDKSQQLDSGLLPATLTNVPQGSYQLTVRRKRDQRELPVVVSANTNNSVQAEFIYGAAVIESDPPGATVMSGGDELGITPLVLPELEPGAFDFVLQKNEFESVAGNLTITANQTNGFRTNLVSEHYTRAIARARYLYSEKNFASAAEAATEALKYKPDDEAATQLHRNATGRAHLERAEQSGNRGDYATAIKDANAALEFLPDSEYAKTLLADMSKREQERLEAERKRQVDLAERERKKQEAEVAAQMRQQRLNHLSTMFYELNRIYNNAAQFTSHELTTTNAAAGVATAINNALGSGQPRFEIITYEWPQANYFKIQLRHQIGVGYRECLIVGAQVQDGETKILWKVFEYENPPELKLLNGFLTAATSIKITSQDPQVEQRKAERFQERVKEGIRIVQAGIQKSIE